MFRRTHLRNKHTMLQGILCGFFAMAITVASSGPVFAQGHGQDQVADYIERTEELLIWAQGLISETQSVTSRRVLDQAVGLHKRSKGLMGNGHMMEALGVSRRSRGAMWHSVRLARESMGFEERIRIRAERFGDQHSQLLERALEVRDRQAMEFLRRAERHTIRAREQYHQGDFKLSWKMLEQAGDLMRRAARMLADGTTPERLEMEMDRVRMLIERTRGNLGPESEAQALRLLAEAEESLARARDGMAQGHPGRALQMAGLARRLAIRAASLNGAGPDEEAVRRQMDRFDQRSGRVADAVRDSGSKQARDMYERALNHRAQAAEALAKGNPEVALRQIRAAHDLLGQAEDLVR